MRPPKGVPRDEWLLAIGLAGYRGPADDACAIAEAIAPGESHLPSSPTDVVFMGAYDVLSINRMPGRCPERQRAAADMPDFYAAGAALAMALEVPS